MANDGMCAPPSANEYLRGTVIEEMESFQYEFNRLKQQHNRILDDVLGGLNLKSATFKRIAEDGYTMPFDVANGIAEKNKNKVLH